MDPAASHSRLYSKEKQSNKPATGIEALHSDSVPPQTAADSDSASPSGDDAIVYLRGFRFWVVSFLNAIMLFLVQIEISIVTTSLVAITNDLGGFDTASWVVSSYLLGYVGVVVIISKLSDIFGRKPAFVLCILAFTIFSGGCAAVRTMPQLITLRALQGVGGGGSYALSTIMIIEIVPPHKYSTQVAYTGIAIVIDFPGCILLLLATMSFTSAFQEAGSQFSWNSAYVIVLLIVSVVLWLALIVWERHVTLSNNITEPVLPWRFLTSRVMAGILLGIVLLGGPLTVTTFQLPQRFQLINGLSSLDAGVRLVPFGAAVPIGTVASANIAGKLQVPAVYIIIAGAVLQVVGFALLGTLEASTQIPPAVYGYQVIAGLGCGISFQTLFLAIPFIAEKRDHGRP
ncbi:putative efflux pump antibiotic resistance protein [Eutypa lata UCREL1]|uniref:Putative efflux pump antibiotic resistance protein n=1 Tax=Eutypa lata (strain UCR-EL1) TaxID=1287681 RepID=M7SL93_EUTLA|nr:putative efflux pump antibiotic resistance protein [Eutypa lata UCREL1]